MAGYYEIQDATNFKALTWGTTSRAPLEQMKVGQSFPVPAEHVKAMRSKASRYGISNNKKFAVRKGADGKHHCLRLS